MSDISRSLPAVGALAACVASFGVGLFMMNSKEEETDQPAAAIAASNEQKASTDSAPKPDKPKGDAKNNNGGIAGLLTTNAPATFPTNGLTFPGISSNGPIGPWKERSGYGLPNPRKLTGREKQALNLLGKAEAIHSANYTRKTLNDGSTIPGVPPLEKGEAKKRLLEKVEAKGLGDGFDEFIREMAIQNPDHIEIAITNQANWEDVEKVLKGSNDASYKRSANVYPIVWKYSGDVSNGDWLCFGLSAGKVRYVKAEFPLRLMIGNADTENGALIAAELVPGGRSPPDPDKAWKKAKPRPKEAGPAAIEALQKLGVVNDIKLNFMDGKLFANKIDDPNKLAEEAIGKPLYPDLVALGRKFQRSQVDALIVTPSTPLALDQMTDIMNDTTMRTDDTTTFPGTKVRWYRYFWIEYGIVDGQVKKVRIHVNIIPAKL